VKTMRLGSGTGAEVGGDEDEEGEVATSSIRLVVRKEKRPPREAAMSEHQRMRGGWSSGDWRVVTARRLTTHCGLQLGSGVGFVVAMWLLLECRMLVAGVWSLVGLEHI
jgi:hypothetical protein